MFGDKGTLITSVKPNVGHTEGASGLVSLIKAVMSLEHRTIPPNIEFNSPNPKIPFKEGNQLFLWSQHHSQQIVVSESV